MQFKMFAENKSTRDEWFILNRGLVPIRALDRSHVEEIIKQYELAAVEIITFTLGPSPLSGMRQKNSLTVQAFIRRNVKAWRVLKDREAEFQKSDAEKILAKERALNYSIPGPVFFEKSAISYGHMVNREKIERMERELAELRKRVIG
jgi:hypothetical protein